MSTALTVANRDQFALLLPDQTQALIDTVQAMGGFTGLMQYRLKIPAGGVKFFTVETEDGEQALASFDAVVLCVIPNQRQWHADSPEDSGGGKAPDCASLDGLRGWGRRSRDGEDVRQPATWADCAACQWNQWGSSRKGGKGKDCKESAVLWFLRPDRGLPDAMTVPATSLNVLKAYQVKLMGARCSPYQAMTRIGLEQAKNDGGNVYSKLTLTRSGSVPEEMQAGAVMLATAIRQAMEGRTPFVNEPTIDAD